MGFYRSAATVTSRGRTHPDVIGGDWAIEQAISFLPLRMVRRTVIIRQTKAFKKTPVLRIQCWKSENFLPKNAALEIPKTFRQRKRIINFHYIGLHDISFRYSYAYILHHQAFCNLKKENNLRETVESSTEKDFKTIWRAWPWNRHSMIGPISNIAITNIMIASCGEDMLNAVGCLLLNY